MDDSLQGNSGDARHGDDRRYQNRRASDNAEPLTVTIESAAKQQYSYAAKQYRLNRAGYRLQKKAYCATHWTMVFLIIYTGLTLVVAVSSVIATVFTKRAAQAANVSADTAQKQFEASQRPYLGVDTIKQAGFKGGMLISAQLKNFGTVPAYFAIIQWDTIIEPDKEVRGHELPTGPQIVFPGPGGPVMLAGVSLERTKQVMAGDKELFFRAIVEYSIASHKQTYNYCNQYKYDRQANVFLNFGMCGLKPYPTKTPTYEPPNKSP
jgi:hypothetical protein